MKFDDIISKKKRRASKISKYKNSIFAFLIFIAVLILFLVLYFLIID